MDPFYGAFRFCCGLIAVHLRDANKRQSAARRAIRHLLVFPDSVSLIAAERRVVVVAAFF